MSTIGQPSVPVAVQFPLTAAVRDLLDQQEKNVVTAEEKLDKARSKVFELKDKLNKELQKYTAPVLHDYFPNSGTHELINWLDMGRKGQMGHVNLAELEQITLTLLSRRFFGDSQVSQMNHFIFIFHTSDRPNEDAEELISIILKTAGL